MTRDDMLYALSKQLDSAESIHTDYGDIELDDELKQALVKVIRPVLQARLDAEVQHD